ncbi:MAG: 3-dehydroquinate synthase [Propioniciclava sp.]
MSAERPYPVIVGHDLGDQVEGAVGEADRVAIVHSEKRGAQAQRLAARLAVATTLVPVPDGEAAKQASALANAWGALADAGFTRSDAVVGIGGGATTDLAGFLAATWLRGVTYVSVPTTLLAMVDAAVGGKTGINLPQGKNLVGSFWEPSTVLCDLDYLQTLPPDDLRGGLAEMVKHGFIADERTLEIFESDPGAMLDPTSAALTEAVARSIRVKAGVVSGDLRERTSVGASVGREVLNYGHTLGHAIERREQFRWRHGYAVSVGLHYAALLSQRLGYAHTSLVQRHADILASVGLPLTYHREAWPELRPAMALDKKSRGSSVRFVLLRAVADPFIEVAPPEPVLRSAYADLTG